MPLTPGTGRVSVTVSAALPIRLKVGALPVCCQTWASTGPADSPGRFGVIDVAGVGKGTVSVVPQVRAVGRACARSVVPRMKFTIGRPKPRFAKPLPVIVKLAGGVARSIELGVMPLTPGTGRVSVTVKIGRASGRDGVWGQRWASAVPGDGTARVGVSHKAG